MEATTRYKDVIDPEGVSHPIHYNVHPSGVECIDLIRWLNFNVGSAVKYVMRRGEKGDPIKDLKKAEWYLQDFLFSAFGDDLEEFEQPVRRTDRIDPGEIKHRWNWDQVIITEPDLLARRFYSEVARLDIPAALSTVREMIVATKWPNVDHEFRTDAPGRQTCTYHSMRGLDPHECGLPPEAHRGRG